MHRTLFVGLSRFILFLVACLTFTAQAAIPTIEWNDATASRTDFRMGIFVDLSEKMSIEQVIKQDFIESSNRVSLGTKAKQTWSKIDVVNNSSSPQTLYLHHPYAYHNRQISLYEVTKGQVLLGRVLNMDDSTTFNWMYGGAAVFDVELLPGQSKTLYVESASFSHQWFSLNLYNKDQSQRALLGSFNDIALLVGMLLSLIVYNFLLFSYSRQRENLYYACYLISGAIWIALSYGLLADMFSFVGSTALRWHLTLMSMPIFLLLFMMDIFETRQNYRKEHWAMVAMLTLLVIEFAYGLIDIAGALRYSSTLAGLMMLVTMSVSISLLIKKHPLALYFLLGHSLFVGFSTLAVRFYQGKTEFTYLASHAVGIGIMLEALALALIIAYRIRLLEEIKASQEELKHQAETDPLTNLLNRRHFHNEAEREFAMAKLSQSNLSVILCDIDLFKQVNDQHGHAVGDQVIINVANTLTQYARKSDIVARYGGEEFILLLPGASVIEAQHCAERIRQAVEKLHFETDTADGLTVTLSLGIASVILEQPLEESIKHADEALYQAKHNGRNNVQIRSLSN